MIGGTGRSGSNILKSVFGRNSHVHALPFEFRFLIDPDGLIDFFTSYAHSWSPYQIDKRLRRLEKFLFRLGHKGRIASVVGNIIKRINPSGRVISPPQYYGWELEKWFPDYNLHVRNLINDLTLFSFNGCWPGADSLSVYNNIYFQNHRSTEKVKQSINLFLTTIFDNILKHNNKSVFVEDNTWNILFADKIMEILPNSKLIHIVRDPRDVLASMKKQRWAPDSVPHLIEWYSSIMTQWQNIKEKINSDNFIEIKFEDLVTDTNTIVNKLTDFVGIPFEKSMVTLNLTDKANINRWKNDFSQRDIDTIQVKLSSFFSDYGYKL